MSVTASARETSFQRISRLIGITGLAPILLLAILPVFLHIVQKPDLGMALRNLEVHAVDVGGPAAGAGLRVGDRVVAFEGESVDTVSEWFAAIAGRYDREPRSVTVARGDQLLTMTVLPRRQERPAMVFGLSTWLAGLAFLMIGWWVLSRRRDEVARDFFGLSMIFAFFLSDVVDLPSVPYQQTKLVLREILQYLWPAAFLRFIVLFPAPSPVAGHPARRWLYAPAVAFMLLTLVAQLAGHGSGSTTVHALGLGAQIYVLGYFVAGLIVFGRKVLRRDRPVLHTKLRVILLGLVLGMVPFLVAVAAGNGLVPSFANWEYLGFSLLLIPVSFGLAIMRYGALDTAFVVRTSLVYGLLTMLVLTGYLVAVAVLGDLISRTYRISAYPILVMVITASCVLVLPVGRRLQTWVDAAFYPSRRANRNAVAALSRALAVETDADAAHGMLLARLYHLYRPHKLRLYLAPSADVPHLQDVGRCPESLPPGPEVPGDDPLLGFLDRLRRPVHTEEFEDWISAPGGRRQPTALPLSGTVLLVPLITGNRLLGVLLWGAKSDAGLYSQDDLANLATLALQVAPVLESLRLHEESLRRHQLETELAVARDIQSQLLPREPLAVRGAFILGRTDPCRQVGGDYYDYFPLDDQTLAFCIADVAGKGIPAALMMSTVRVIFRELAQSGLPPEEVIAELDTRLAAIASAGRFVCFFYGTLDTRRGVLSYCNGGLEPPVLFRRDGTREELRRGGPLVGIAAGVRYRRGAVQLGDSDLLLGYTDGITEQTSRDGKEFFESERLLTMVARGREEPPEVVCGRVFSGVDAFGGDEASDDRTVIVLKYNQLG